MFLLILLKLSAHFKELGAPLAFDGSKADFSGINSDAKDLHISKVIHQAVVEVNEEGTVAAAATGMMMGITCFEPVEPIEFYVNKPFLFIIHETIQNSILFLGKVVHPK